MLRQAEIEDEKIIRCLQDAYDLSACKISFLPVGADFNTIVYKATTTDSIDYFLKLRRSDFDEASVLIPKYLFDLGVTQIIPPLTTNDEKLWIEYCSFSCALKQRFFKRRYLRI